ncbi:MAG: NAD(P)/FAD-dependent oxidoreductase [Candidatus Binatia bacterium]
MADRDVVIVGAGPAGLTASYLLTQQGRHVTVLEADPHHVGGIARTVEYRGYRFDVGPHRFFSKSTRVEALWDELLPGDLLSIARQTRIHYRGAFFSYPLRPAEALRRLGAWQSTRAAASYMRARCFPTRTPLSFADWVTNAFGAHLFETFFRTYTEKVWGMPCAEISADWASQRIKGLSLGAAVWSAVRPRRATPAGAPRIKSLIETFRYPRRGAGTMWEAAAQRTRAQGGEVRLGCRATGLAYDAAARTWTTTFRQPDGSAAALTSAHVISSAAMGDLAAMLSPALRAHAAAAAAALRYRDLLVVELIVKDRDRFADHWIYIHDPHVRVARIQNHKAWSPALIADPATTAYGLEYFCFAADGLWQRDDAALVDLAARELVGLRLAEPGDVLDGCVVRQPRAYPVYDAHYAHHVAAIRDELAQRFPGLHLVGRNGMHKYNNQDHAMMTAMLTVDAILGRTPPRDPWRVNEDAEYHEEDHRAPTSGLRLVPRPINK